MFQDGKETGRIPAIISGQVQKCNFKEEEVVNTFDLNNLYTELQKDKRFKQETKETKKDQWMKEISNAINNLVVNSVVLHHTLF